MQTEMISEAIDDSLDNDEAEEETEELTNQVNFQDFFNFQLDFTSLRLVKESIPGRAKGFMNRKLYSFRIIYWLLTQLSDFTSVGFR